MTPSYTLRMACQCLVLSLMLLLVACLVPSSSVAQAAEPISQEAQPLAADPVVEQRLIAISDELRCLVCQNESLSGSRADLALDLRRELRELIRQGQSDDQIKAFMVARYGDFILYRPPLKRITWLLWVGPFVMLLLGLLVLWRVIRRSPAKPATLSPQDRARAQALMDTPHD